jgi:hypothetical protein
MNSDGSLIEGVGHSGKIEGQFQDIHWVAVSKRGAIYTADFAGKRVQKFVPGKR